MTCDTTARIIEWSEGNNGKQIITFHLRYPLMIHAELMTHRDLSRNAGSSRAIPVEKRIAEVLSNPMVPRYWGKNQKGMQASEELSGLPLFMSKFLWNFAAKSAGYIAKGMNLFGGHKQVINRLLAPFIHIDVVVTTTELTNFLWLRDHKDAEPHIADLARAMIYAMEVHKTHNHLFGMEGGPRKLTNDPTLKSSWHLPYVTDDERATMTLESLIKLSIARCARVSYKAFDGTNSSFEADINLVDKLIGSEPLHASPTEHQAYPDQGRKRGTKFTWNNPELHGNFKGFIQYRKTLENEVKRADRGL